MWYSPQGSIRGRTMPDAIDAQRVPMRYVRLLARRFDSADERCSTIFDGVGLTATDLEDPNFEVGFAQQARLLDNVTRAFGDGWILDAPEIWMPASQGALSIAALSAATLGDAIAVLAAYVPVQAANQRLTTVREGDCVHLRHGISGGLPESWAWIGTLSGILFLAEMLKLLVGQKRARARFEFTRSAPDYASRLEHLLGGEIRWGAGSNAVILPAAIMDARSPFHDPITNEAALQRLEQARRSERAACGVRGRLEHMLSISDSGRLPNAHWVFRGAPLLGDWRSQASRTGISLTPNLSCARSAGSTRAPCHDVR
jgi:Arabinose-binding domain of AraC transcription regulator, N-term